MAKSIMFDTGPIISLALNSLLHILPFLKKNLQGKLYISRAVKGELVDKPMNSKRFKFEAMRVLSYITKNTIEVVESEQITQKTKYLMNIANNTFMARGNPIQLVHYGEMEALAAAIILGSSAFVVDERTTRLLIENPDKLRRIMEHKLHTRIQVNKNSLNDFRKEVGEIKVIRSTELAVIAYKLGLLDRYLPKLPEPNKQLLDGVLWGIKLNGCSISQREIDTIVKVEAR